MEESAKQKYDAPFFWLADTWWYGMTNRTKWKDFKILVADRVRKGFTVIQTVVGIPPEIDIFSPQAANSGGLPFIKRDYSSSRVEKNSVISSRQARTVNPTIEINYRYFDEVDRKIKYLVDNGLVPCIFGAWGHHIEILGVDLIKQWWSEIIKRYAKYPVVWCLTGEADLPINMHKLLTKIKYFLFNIKPAKEHIKKWNEVARYIKRIDRYKRLLTVHIQSKTTASELFGDPSWLDIDSIQSGHSKDSLEFMKSAISKANKKKRPIINLEPWYEGILGNFWEKDQILAFRTCIDAGAAGHSYGAHGIWQMATKKDNFMGHWGKSDWKKALNFPGGIALGKTIKQYRKKSKKPIIV